MVICPKCGSNNVSFNREKERNSDGSFSYRTISLCKDCGYAWDQAKEDANKILIWGLGWICLFPLPFMILLKRNEKIKADLKKYIITTAWILYFVLVGWVLSTTYETVSVVNCRSGAGMQYKIIEKIQKGKYLRCKAFEKGWCQIKRNGRICYLNENFIEKLIGETKKDVKGNGNAKTK